MRRQPKIFDIYYQTKFLHEKGRTEHDLYIASEHLFKTLDEKFGDFLTSQRLTQIEILNDQAWQIADLLISLAMHPGDEESEKANTENQCDLFKNHFKLLKCDVDFNYLNCCNPKL